MFAGSNSKQKRWTPEFTASVNLAANSGVHVLLWFPARRICARVGAEKALEEASTCINFAAVTGQSAAAWSNCQRLERSFL